MAEKQKIKSIDSSKVETQIAVAKLRNCPTSPRKMRLVVDQIRGLNVNKALIILKHSPKDASIRLEKLLLSAISNWQNKYSNESEELMITEIFVDYNLPSNKFS